jgi:hypothetical protein
VKVSEKRWPVSIFQIVFKIIVGLIFGTASIVALSRLLAAVVGDKPIGTAVVMGLVVLLVAFSPNVRRAFGRGFLCLGAAVFALPLSTMILSGVVPSESISIAAEADKTMARFGGVVAGGLITGVAGFIGFLFWIYSASDWAYSGSWWAPRRDCGYVR